MWVQGLSAADGTRPIHHETCAHATVAPIAGGCVLARLDNMWSCQVEEELLWELMLQAGPVVSEASLSLSLKLKHFKASNLTHYRQNASI